MGVREKAQPFGGARAASRTEAGAAQTAPRSDQKKGEEGQEGTRRTRTGRLSGERDKRKTIWKERRKREEGKVPFD